MCLFMTNPVIILSLLSFIKKAGHNLMLYSSFLINTVVARQRLYEFKANRSM